MRRTTVLEFNPPRWRELTQEQLGRAIAFVIHRGESVHKVEVTRDGIVVHVLNEGDTYPGDIENQIAALVLTAVERCPCGCGADMNYQNCLQEQPASRTLGDGAMTEAEQAHVRAGEIITAIKMVRTRTGVGLKDAKDIVDAYVVTLPRTCSVSWCTQVSLHGSRYCAAHQ